MNRKVAVIGGGMAGLEAAVRMAARPGMEVEVIEAGPATRRRHVDWDTSIHPGDEKVRWWTSDGWGFGAGLSERLGGRSLCYHGVLLGLTSKELVGWHPCWQERLVGPAGCYAQVYAELSPRFPGLVASPQSPAASRVGLRHAPQAARYDGLTGEFEAYSPLSAALRLAVKSDRFRIVRGRARSLRRGRLGWDVEVATPSDSAATRQGFDACVLASSAIGNIQILTQTTGELITTTITDHFCVGALARIEPGEPLDSFRHPMLWTGYRPVPSLSANIFVQERPTLPNGNRLVSLAAVIEQGSGPADFSTLAVQPSSTDGIAAAHITTAVSSADLDRIGKVRQELLRLADEIAQGSLLDITAPRPGGGCLVGPADGENQGEESRKFGEAEAFHALLAEPLAGRVAQFELPYGSFEHEACSHPLGGALKVTTDLEVEALPGVYLAGPGNFPRLGAANPALTTISMSRWLGDSLAG
ncbi:MULTISPECIES: FAD-binding protein [Protofrankia]|uniref:FAD-dependent pyridine nucleotide-disulfide oxidoreductase n=1 Tax=Candidatus Protofrankia datiscae TaxID=2716812 RepID=F8AY87_9ACTN|nr:MULTISPECIES: FAD-binding protein [Protofrankia]AEH09517.1 FAD-dependent pyridine nucleotide-disulfide oxidoreductase [Candidatus Protofrankia datiscae]